MDAEMEAKIFKMEKNIISTVNTSINMGLKEIKASIIELITKDIDHLKDRIEQYRGWHEEHFEDIKRLDAYCAKIDGIITNTRISIINEIDKMFEEKEEREQKEKREKSKSSWGKSAVIFASLSGMGALIVAIIAIIIGG